MKSLLKSIRLAILVGAIAAQSLTGSAAEQQRNSGRWTAAWVSAQQLTEAGNMPPSPGLDAQTLRQIVRPTLSGTRVRVTFSNVFGDGPMKIAAAHIARSAGDSAIVPESDAALTFDGKPSVTIEAGASRISDSVPFTVTARTNLSITTCFDSVPAALTGHPGSRTTSFVQTGNTVSMPVLTNARRADHWYVISGVDVWTIESASAIVVLGDSITDGRGSTTNKNDRWPDILAARLADTPATANIAVLNQGIGGNRLLRDGLGPNALARFDRDVLALAGVRWLIVLEGVNDIGTAVGARAHNQPAATAADIIAEYRQIIIRAHSHGIRVYGATIMAFEGFAMYSTNESETDRQTVNQWIRTSGEFDGVIDFDAATRDPAHPARLATEWDSGDHLHLSPAGYRAMADSVDLGMFTKQRL